MKLLILNGANLNRLGQRETKIYGKATLAELDGKVRAYATKIGVETVHFQSNHEGRLIDVIHAADDDCDGIVFNPGAFTHYAWALRDALTSISRPCVEVHLSDVNAREEWRKVSVIKDVCVGSIAGKGPQGYLDAVRLLHTRLKESK